MIEEPVKMESPPGGDGSRVEGIEVFFDGDCPLCSREVAFLRGRSSLRTVRFTDIATLGPPGQQRAGRTRDALMDRIHARLGDGTVIEGVEVFRRLYERLGWGWLVAPTRWPILRQLADAAYALFARNRMRLTGRGPSKPSP